MIPTKTKYLRSYEPSHVKQTVTMPSFLEKKLQKEYGKLSKTPYKVMNKIGAMKGNKVTAKGKAMETKHNKDIKSNFKKFKRI